VGNHSGDAMPVQKSERKVAVYTGLGRPKLAADTKIVVDQPLEIEDEFRSLYEAQKATNEVLEPKFNPTTLMQICFRNSILQQCIHVMEVNIDGTGHTIELIDQGSEKEKKARPKAPPDLKKSPPFEKPGKDTATFAKKALFGGQSDEEDKEDPEAPRPLGKKPVAVEPKDPEQIRAEDFFKEPYPGVSFVTLRRKLRVDMEQCGYGFLEAVRNITGDLVMLRHLPAQTVRKLRLDAPVMVERTLVREGKEITVQLPMRERRYVQSVGNKQYYYKEFGSQREVHRDTGHWLVETNGKLKNPENDPESPVSHGPTNEVGRIDTPVKKAIQVDTKGTVPKLSLLPGADIVPPNTTDIVLPAQRGTEIIEFGVDRDPTSAYYLPRWINVLPSVLGSRKSEEYNLEFFDAGGIPPILILLEGGTLTTTVRQQLQQQLANKGSSNRAAIVEIQSASGTLEKPGTVGVKVERFGDSRQGDALFTNYKESTEEDVRTAFRLPPLFLGKADSYNFATAVVAYMVAEEQVFGPERKEFDEIINKTIMKELKITKFQFVSKPITLKNAEVMMQAIQLGKEFISPEEFVDKLNEISGLNMEYDEEAAQRTVDANDPAKIAQAEAKAQADYNPKALPGQGPPQNPANAMRQPAGNTTATKVVAIRKHLKTAEELIDLAQSWVQASGLAGYAPDAYAMSDLTDDVATLTSEDRRVFDKLVAMKTISRSYDPEGMSELANCCIDMKR
jgi:PBSX family phage portal protein